MVTVALVGGLQAAEVSRSPLIVFHQPRLSRSLLGSLWQVEAAAVALVVAASLFVFESLTRQRQNLPLSEYANRSGLAQFLMFAASGLIAVPVVLFSTDQMPAPSAALAAAVIGLGGLVALPFFFSQAMRVVHPSWLRDERLAEIRRAVAELVESQAFERAGLVALREWADDVGLQVQHRIAYNDERVTEVAPAEGVVIDVDLDVLEEIAQTGADEVVVLCRVGERVWERAALIARQRTDGPVHSRPVVTISMAAVSNGMEVLLRDLHEEAVESIRRGSPVAAEQVAELYVEVWLAWPRAWAKYGQRLEGGLLGEVEPFRIGPTDELKRQTWSQIELAIDRGLRDHVDTLAGIMWEVGYEAVRMDATDLIDQMNNLASGILTVKSRDDLASLAVEKSWRYQISIGDKIAQRLEDAADEAKLKEATRHAETVEKVYANIIESLRILLEHARLQAFRELDNRFTKILQFWDPGTRLPFAARVIDDPQRYGADPELLAEAERVLAAGDIRTRLDDYRRAGRITLLGWILRLEQRDESLPEEALDVARDVAGSLGSVEEVVRSMGVAFQQSQDLLSRWLMRERLELEVGVIDTNGPLLRAFAMFLLHRSQLSELPPAPWMTEHRVKRLHEVLREVAFTSHLWTRLGEEPEEIEQRSEDLHEKVDEAEDRQRERERLELIDRDLDSEKVKTFRRAVVDGWREQRQVLALVERCGTSVQRIPADSWKEEELLRFDLRPQPKGLFVTPTNWVGLENDARDIGRQLAQREVAEIIRAVVSHGNGMRGKGGARERARSLIDKLKLEGFRPSLIVVPINYTLVDSLGLGSSGARPGDDPLAPRIKGEIEGIPVVDWWRIPEKRIYAVDLDSFCAIEEGVSDNEEPQPPNVTLEPISESDARGIVESRIGEEGEDDLQSVELNVQQLQTRLRSRVERPYRVRVKDADAVRSVVIPKSERKR